MAVWIGALAGFVAGDAARGGRFAAGIVGVAIAILYLIGYAGASRFNVRRLEIRLPTLPPGFDGVTIAQLCDLHVGPHTSRRFLRRVAATVRELSPDLIVVPGDLVDDRPEDVRLYARAFGHLRAHLGTYMSPGNHDIYQGWEAMENALRTADVGTLLVNESRLISRNGDTIAIAGTGDPAGLMVGNAAVAPNVDRALAGIPAGMTTIVLAHNPALWKLLASRGVALTLSGHTHWGQFAMPSRDWSLASVFLEHSMGRYESGNSQLYVSPGTGHWGIPFRIGAIGEVTFITLKRGRSKDIGGS